MKNYHYTVPEVEHEGDYQPFATAIRSGGGIIEYVDWTEFGEDAIIHFAAYPNDLETIKSKIKELLWALTHSTLFYKTERL